MSDELPPYKWPIVGDPTPRDHGIEDFPGRAGGVIIPGPIVIYDMQQALIRTEILLKEWKLIELACILRTVLYLKMKESYYKWDKN